MARYPRRRKRPAQNGVNAIFSGKIPRRVLIAESSNEADPRSDSGLFAEGPTPDRGIRNRLPLSEGRASRILVSIILIGLGFSLITGAFFVDSSSLHASSPGPAGSGPGAVKAIPRIFPSFYAISSIPETLVSNGSSYRGASAMSTGDFLVVQVAYSQGGPGNLPDVAGVQDTSSNLYSRRGSASPGVGYNFWEQIWVTRASANASTVGITVNLDWESCLIPCVSSIIITMNIARYRNVEGIGSLVTVASNESSTSQAASVPVVRPGSIIVELLSHGAYNNCQVDTAQPGSGQTSRTCYTGTTERTELFDHTLSSARVYNESYSWSQAEVQRGIYLELDAGAS